MQKPQPEKCQVLLSDFSQRQLKTLNYAETSDTYVHFGHKKTFWQWGKKILKTCPSLANTHCNLPFSIHLGQELNSAAELSRGGGGSLLPVHPQMCRAAHLLTPPSKPLAFSSKEPQRPGGDWTLDTTAEMTSL